MKPLMKPIGEMTNDEFMKHIVEDCLQGWIPLGTYLRLFPEETKGAVIMRIKRKLWVRGVHHVTPEGSRMWVNLIAIRKWVVGDVPDVQFASESAPETVVRLD